MIRTKSNFVVTNIVNVALFVVIFVFGYWRWGLLQDVLEESAVVQKDYTKVHDALMGMVDLSHLGQQVLGWGGTEETEYKEKLNTENILIHKLKDIYSQQKVDSMCSMLNEEGRLLLRIHDTLTKREENENNLREERNVLVKDTETTIKHKTGHVFRKSSEEVSSRIKHRTVRIPSVNEIAFANQLLYGIELHELNDSLAGIDKWLDVNLRQILNTDERKGKERQEVLLEKGSGIGRTTFTWGMFLLAVVYLFNVWNSWRRKKAAKRLQDKSEKLAVESEKNKELIENRRKMMYAIVHDLRTPLGIIIGYNDMEKRCPTKNDKYISAIGFSANQLKSMIDQLLEYFRLESNRTTLKPKDFSLMELTNELTTAFELKASEKGIEFKKPHLQNVILRGDYEKICHIAINLLDNAFKFTEKGSVTLAVSYSGDSLTIAVNDTGIGIKSTDQKRVFTPFTRFPNAVATGKEGFGIGLSTAKMLVDLMDGTITFDSSEKGSTFIVSLPLSKAMVAEKPTRQEVVKASDERKRILVVDDSKTWLLMMQGILEQNGFDCDICSKSNEVFDMMREKNYSLVILDLQMPGKSGIELLHLMRKSRVGNSQTVPVAVSTASPEDIREDLLATGFDEYIPKLSETETMVRLINDTISNKTKAVSPDFTMLRKSVAQYLIEETNEAVEELHKAVKTMDFDGMNIWAHNLKSSWILYRVGILIDPIMEIAKKKDASASLRLAEHMAEIDKMAKIIVKKAQEKLNEADE